MELIKSQTFTNLARAFAGECQAHVRYKFIEYGARNEGYTALAEMIDKVVYNEFNHARMFYTFLQKASDKPIENIEICGGFPFKEKWNLTENLRLAAEDENMEASSIYPEFAAVARKEGFNDVAALFDDVIQVENCHKMLFTQLYEQMKNGTMYAQKTPTKWKCGGCGYETTAKTAPEECPLCKAKQGVFLLKIEDQA